MTRVGRSSSGLAPRIFWMFYVGEEKFISSPKFRRFNTPKSILLGQYDPIHSGHYFGRESGIPPAHRNRATVQNFEARVFIPASLSRTRPNYIDRSVEIGMCQQSNYSQKLICGSAHHWQNLIIYRCNSCNCTERS
jgi:hypothetical protein